MQWCVPMVTTQQICLLRISETSRHGSRSDLTTKVLPLNTVAPHDCLSRISIYGRAPNGCRASDSCTRISLVSGKASATTTMETRGANSVTRATNDVACGNSGCSSRRNAHSKDDHAPGNGLAQPCLGPARRREVDGTRWILRGSIVLDCVGAERGRAS